jgi:DNA-binding FadR family transcriptional regulator
MSWRRNIGCFPSNEGVCVRVTDEAIDRIKQMIVTGELQPGDRLPREPDLAARLGLSRSSLREAGQGARADPGAGGPAGRRTYVTSLDPSLLMETMGFVLDLHQDASVLEFFEYGGFSSRAAAARAALRMADEDIGALRKLLDEPRPGAVGGGSAHERCGGSTGWSRSAVATGRSPRSSTACASPPTGPGSGAA